MYEIKRIDLKGKLSSEEALIQSGLDSGWNVFLKSGQDKIELLTDSEREYLLGSAISYFLSGDPVIKARTELYLKKTSQGLEVTVCYK